jgi:hypothetical protein
MARDIQANISSANQILIGTSALFCPPKVTVSFWFNQRSFATVGFNRYISKIDNGGTEIYQITSNANSAQLIYYTENGGNSGTQASISLGVWHHVAFSNDPSNVSQGKVAYLDGVLDLGPTTSGSMPAAQTTNPLKIGNYSAGTASAVDGSLADVAIWNAALTVSEMRELYYAAKRPYQIRPQSLIGYWPLDGYGAQALDRSIYRNHGVVTGGIFVPGPPRLGDQPILLPLPDPSFVMAPINAPLPPPPFILMPQIVM